MKIKRETHRRLAKRAMTDALILGIVAVVPSLVTGLGTYVLTARKGKSDEALSLVNTLIGERTGLVERIKALEDAVESLKRERDHDSDLRMEIEDLDQRIRHEGASLVRNCLFRADPDAEDPLWQDLRDRAKALELMRDLRRETAARRDTR